MAVSVDSAVINAEYVFVGRIQDLPSYGSTASATNVIAKVEIRLKGEVSGVTQTLVTAPQSALLDWKARGSRLLFIDSGKPIDLSASNLMVFTAKPAVLQKPEQVIQAAREAIQQHLGVRKINTCLMPLPPELAKKYMRPGSDELPPQAVVVPADATLEAWAVRALRSDSPIQRSEGVTVLRHFPSDANTARLKALLADSGFVICQDAPGGPKSKCYIVRKTAYDTLIAWGAKPEQPEFYEKPPL
jgi:hypothetical protein